MESRQIRKRWQITIPRQLRRKLNLYIGQVLTWGLEHDERGSHLVLYTGTFATMGAAHMDEEARKWRGQKRSRFRKSDKIKRLQEERKSKIEAELTGYVGTDLRQLITEFSGYLLNLQAKLNQSEGRSWE